MSRNPPEKTNDERRTTNDQRRTTNNQRRTTNDQQPKANATNDNNERRTTNNQRPTPNDKRRTTNEGGRRMLRKTLFSSKVSQKGSPKRTRGLPRRSLSLPRLSRTLPMGLPGPPKRSSEVFFCFSLLFFLHLEIRRPAGNAQAGAILAGGWVISLVYSVSFIQFSLV